MSRIKTLPFIVSILFCAIQNNANKAAAKNDLVPYVSDKLQICINKLFYYLKINKNFRRPYKIRILLIMYNNLYNAIEYNWQIFSNVKKSVVVGEDIKNNYLLRIVNEALENNYTEHNNSTKAENNTFTSTEEEEDNASAANNITPAYRIENKTTETSNKSEDILDKFLDKINKLTVNDFVGEPLNKTYLKINEKNMYKIQRRRNFDLKTWDPNEYPDDKLSISRRMAIAELIKKYPFVASIHVMDKLTCSGSIISKNAVLTTASCLPFSYDSRMIQQMPDIIKVRVGSDYANNFGELVPIVDVEFHPQYDPKTLKNNLAIIRLNKLHKYAKTRPKIRKIRLDDNPLGPRSYMSNVQILGFGAGNDDLSRNDQRLAVTNLNLMPLQQCKDIYSMQFVNELEFCAGFTTRRQTLCHGDVGAPGVADGYLLGMVSFGPPVCGKQNAPTVFIKIGAFADWIDTVINQNWIHPVQNIDRPEVLSTRMLLEEEDETSFSPTLRTTKTPNYNVQKQNIFKEIKAIMEHLKIPKNRYLLNADLEADYQDPLDFIFGTSTTTSIFRHPLINKSIVPIPGVHFATTKSKYTLATKMPRPDIGLPDDLPYDYINSKIKDSEELDYFIQMLLKEMIPRKKEPPSKVFSTQGMLWQDDYVTEKSNRNTKKNYESIYKYNKDPTFASNELNVGVLRKDDKSLKSFKKTSRNRFPRIGIGKIIGHKITRPFVTLLPNIKT